MSSSNLSSRKTRISAHFLDAAPAEDEIVTVEGWLTYYDEEKKSWIPLERAQVTIYVDGREVGKAETNEYGMFTFAFPAPYKGRHKLEVRFKGKAGYESSSKSLDFQVMEREQKLKLGRLARDVLLLIIALVFLLFVAIFITNMLR
ncbi:MULTISPECIES: Ig-like domain repeat protein [Archaeoglobus]|jgi:hypothetical protein|uniref:Uncharacterized protein AF_0657 n=3 Tax=Archaeoglobus fulgidus TaxID=2234 RepID=Y657_ARCFU|nr:MULTISPECIES: Ig-like domain repeat protein [Archaeoglobus]O29600.1 RecName: Full=Uncharacterized protein AF_0657; Flags: Precursor [Archaeoglobus fulgidus DSM 4304]AAB90587.1 predicted coding region AF_0657 [Archaeoglobus fulgidus DSM 4304]AIG97535.1 hypothetical protein AFULGI_00007370 [Archaeoglobus fulgidus DSM 8774]KUJ93435.1 MAG: hypothetical protein XD40_1350 [Archaeoglobus fulgidus]KUK07088.1 MAG: Uncharacterized protein XD48_0712 [Archaeoglobus fulgidus]MDI3497868.1 hypothetical p